MHFYSAENQNYENENDCLEGPQVFKGISFWLFSRSRVCG